MASIIRGVDVSSTALDARVGHETQGPFRRFGRDAQGVTALAAFRREHGVELVVVEATGGYERLPFGLLWAEGVPAAVVNPRAVRRFAQAMGLLEKTDRIDAGVIAWYAEAERIAPRPPASAAQRRLTAWVTRLRRLTEARVAQANQRRLVDEPEVLACIDEVVASLSKQARGLEAKIVDPIAADPLWAELDAEFRAIEGVAGRTTARSMAEMPEIGTLSGKAAAKLAGLAPIAKGSGKAHGTRPTRAGRTGVRSILSIVAEVVRRHDPDFAAFHARLTAAGKPKKPIRVALAHKPLTRLNAKARDVRAKLEQARAARAAPQPA